MKKYYILLAFYESYLPSALSLHAQIKASIGETQLIVVDNSHNKNLKDLYPTLLVIKGDNRVSEFSGWQSAVKYIQSKDSIDSDDLFIFANDTANRHRFFTFVDRLLFSTTLKKACMDGSRYMVGEVVRSKTTLGIDGCLFNKWMSTYLFAISGSLLKTLKTDLTLGVISDDYVSAITPSAINFTSRISSSLSNHINNWLFPNAKGKGWYNVKRSSAEEKARKSLAIICEKKLSALAINNDFTLYDIYETKVARRYKKTCNKWYRRTSKR